MNNRIALYARPYPDIGSWYDMIDEAARRGMAVLEAFTNLDLAEPDPAHALELRAYAAERGVRFCCLSCYCLMNPENAPEQIARMKGFVDVAKALGSPYFHHTVVSGQTAPEELLDRWDDYFANAVSAVQQIYDYGQSQGVKLVYEDQGYMINGVKNYGKFLEAVDRDVGVLLDTGNNYHVDEDLDDFLDTFLPRICHVHIKDVIRSDEPQPGWYCTLNHRYFQTVPLGQGVMNHEKYIRKLEQAGYTGCYSLEYNAPDRASTLIEDTIETLTAWIEQA